MLISFLGRLQRFVITVLAVVTVVFVAVRLVPGNPAEVLLGDYSTPQLVAALEREMGLDQPIWVQYVRFIGQLAQGNFGYSFRNREAALELIATQYQFTVHLALLSFGFALALGVSTGMLAASFYRTRWDLLIMALNNLWISVPFFWLGLIFLLIFSIQLGWFPLTGAGQIDDPRDLAVHLVIPVVALGLREAAILSRMTRASILETLGEDYVRTARAKGLANAQVMTSHVLRNALLPIIGMASVELILLLGGSMVVEIVFSRPGVGKLFVNAMIVRDYPLVQAIVLLFGICVAVVNFLADFAYSVVDPRARAA